MAVHLELKILQMKALVDFQISYLQNKYHILTSVSFLNQTKQEQRELWLN